MEGSLMIVLLEVSDLLMEKMIRVPKWDVTVIYSDLDS